LIILSLKNLYPEIEPFDTGSLKTNSSHHIYYEQVGNPIAPAVLFLHGGPGSGCNENHRRYFDPDKYRIVLFDQRGCNRSIPNGCVDNNSTQDIINDIESLRQKLNINKSILFGGSWGATLALLYAEQYPENVLGMILRGTFLARQCDFDWFAKSGANKIFPDHWQEFISIFDESEKNELLKSLHRRVFSENKKVQLVAAKAWALWAGRVVTHSLLDEYILEVDNEDKMLNEAKIEMHYAINKYFINENQIINNITNIPDVPVTIIHGRKDLTCLPESSWLVHQSLPSSKLVIVPDAGHLAGESAMIDALVTATDDMADKM
jgi:proline iminopeptidase